MKTHTITTYSFDELSDEAKENALNYIRENWHDLGQHIIDEVMDSLKALQKEIGGELDYSISIVPDRGEFIKFTDYDKELLKELDKKKDDCPLTGVCYDYEVIGALMNDDIGEVLSMLHKEGEYLYSDEGLIEMIEANEYEWTKEGKIY